MDKSAKLYKLAMEKYQKGYIDDSLEYCEKSISANIKNAPALNLKGLLIYFKGDLESARNMWKMNKDLNKDSVSKKYIESTQSDEEKCELYDAAIALLKEIRIREALELLRDCEKSDYNIINVGNAIASCLIKQGKYEESMSYIEKVLKIDRNNKTALENKNMLIEYGIIKGKINHRKSLAIISALILFFIVVYTGINGMRVLSKRNANNNININSNEAVIEKEESKPKDIIEENLSNKSQADDKKEQIQVFPYESIKTAIDERKYEDIYAYYAEWKSKILSINEKTLIIRAEEVLSKEGTEFFYALGNQHFKEKEYRKALEAFKKAYELGRNNYLYSHVIFMMGTTYEKVDDFENALRLYEEYHNNYKDGDYSEEVLYRMTIIYKNIDINKSRKYAEELVNKNSKSIYNNSKLKQILNIN